MKKIKIFMGGMMTGKTIRLKEIKQDLKNEGEKVTFLPGDILCPTDILLIEDWFSLTKLK